MVTSDDDTRKSRTQLQKRKPKKHEDSCYSLSPNSLWSVWYCIIVVSIQIYIIAVSIKCFSRYITLPWSTDDQPYLELNAYVGFLGSSVVIMPFFVAAALLRVGNYPNDGRKICSNITFLPSENNIYENVQSKGKEKRARVLWKHGVPLAPFLHVVSAFCLLLPKVLIQAQLIKHGFLGKSELWSSELDFLISRGGRQMSLSFLPSMNENKTWFHEVRNSESTQSPKVLLDHNSVAISAEFLNFATSLLIYAIRYPSVFWEANKTFGFIFSVQLLLNGFQQLLAFTGFSILYKIQIFNPTGALVRHSAMLMNVTTTMLLFFIYNAAMTATSCTLNCYGLQKHREWIERKLNVQYRISCENKYWRLWGYTSHVSAFIVLLALACSGIPFIHDFIVIYWGSLNGVVLIAIISTVTHIFLWIVLWLFLTTKQRWTFRVNGRKSLYDINETSEQHAVNAHTINDHALKGLKQAIGDPSLLLIIDSEKTYQVREKSYQKAILSLVNHSYSRQKTSSSTDEEDIYWLKPKKPSAKPIPNPSVSTSVLSRTWARNEISSPCSSENCAPKKTYLNTFPMKRKPNKFKYTEDKVKELEDFSEIVSEDGDYAMLANQRSSDIFRLEDNGQSWKGVPV